MSFLRSCSGFDVVLAGQSLPWQGKALAADHDNANEDLAEFSLDKGLKDEVPQCHAHRAPQSAWLDEWAAVERAVSSAQFHIGHCFSQAASGAAAPPVGHKGELNKARKGSESSADEARFLSTQGYKGKIFGCGDAPSQGQG